MAYVSYLHMEKEYRQFIQPSSGNNVIENQDRSLPLQRRIFQPVPEDSQNSIDTEADSTTQFGNDDEISSSTSKTRRAMTDDTLSLKVQTYLRKQTNIQTEGQEMPTSDTVRDSNPNNEQSSTVTVRAVIHGPPQHRQNQARSMVNDVPIPDEQKQLLQSTLSDSEEEDEPPPLPEKTHRITVSQARADRFHSAEE